MFDAAELTRWRFGRVRNDMDVSIALSEFVAIPEGQAATLLGGRISEKVNGPGSKVCDRRERVRPSSESPTCGTGELERFC